MNNEPCYFRAAHGGHRPRQMLGWLLTLAIGTAGCRPADGPAQPEESELPDAKQFAEARIGPLADSGVSGVLRFNQDAGFLRIEGRISGLAAGPYSLQVHGFDDCDLAGDASGKGVALLSGFDANGDGETAFELIETRQTLGSGQRSVVDHAIVLVHGGEPVGCGVITSVPAADYTL